MTTNAVYINYNGTFHKAENPVLSHKNRAFCFGDAVFETMFAYQEKVYFFSDHFERLQKSMKLLKMSIPDNFSEVFFHEEILKLMRKNRFYKGVRVRLTIFRNDGGYYTPLSNEISYIIEASPLETIKYKTQTKGLHICLYNESFKPENNFNSIKTANSLFYVMAGIFKKEKGFDDCILINKQGHIVEALSSNLFYCRGKNIFTPPLSDGCVEGIMRKQIIRIAHNNEFQVNDTNSFTPDVLKEADEIFLSNAVQGIQWVLGYEDKRYFHDVSAFLFEKLKAEFNS